MKNIFFKAASVIAVSATLLTSCTKDLDLTPYYESTAATIYSDPANYKGLLAKIYGGIALSGNKGPAGKPDLSGVDEGFSNYLRGYWNMQELTTDEAVVGWGDPGLPNLHQMTWSSDNIWVKLMYDRIFYQLPLCNEFVRESTEDKLNGHGFSEDDKVKIRGYRSEVRFLRALSYWHAIDLFARVPFITEKDLPGSYYPRQASRQEIFNYIESELKEIEGLLPAPKTNEYGRVDQAVAWTLLAKLYLNANVYVGQNRYTDALTYCKKVIASNQYSLQTVYKELFLTDNNTSPEVIFPILFDGLRTQTWGGMTYLVHAPVGGKMKASDFGINGGWAGLRTTKALVNAFPDTIDGRWLFFTNGQNLEINDISKFTDGYAVAKFKNVNKNGVAGSDPQGNHSDTDFPMFRLADVYLMYAEAVLRGGSGGDLATAINYVNQLRQRAYGDNNHGVTTLTLDDVLNERARELFWEGHRRTDLIRFGKFTDGSYVWPFKGNVKEGQGVDAKYNLFPIPAAELVANPTMTQNSGY